MRSGAGHFLDHEVLTPGPTRKLKNNSSPIKRLHLLIRVSRAAIKGRSIGVLRLKLRMFLNGLRSPDHLDTISGAPVGSALRMLIDQRPEALGLFVWPYQSADWDMSQRLDRFLAHYEVVDTLGTPFAFGPENKVVVMEMDDILPNLKLVLDQPLWMMREGGLTLNLFIDSLRAYSLTFSFFRQPNRQPEVMIGGLQGRDIEGILDTYRVLTKAAHGLRPRDLLMECFSSLCRATVVERIRAVSDKKQHRRHPFFKESKTFQQNYDDIWQERGGSLAADGYYDLPLQPNRKDLEEIKAKKRSMYRRRFEFLDELEDRITENLKSAEPGFLEER